MHNTIKTISHMLSVNEPTTQSVDASNLPQDASESTIVPTGKITYSHIELTPIKEPILDFKEHPVWDKSLCDPHSTKFDRSYFMARRKYFLDLTYAQAESMPKLDRYDRLKFIQDIEGYAYLQRIKAERK
jgi:hypothetical protein